MSTSVEKQLEKGVSEAKKNLYVRVMCRTCWAQVTNWELALYQFLLDVCQTFITVNEHRIPSIDLLLVTAIKLDQNYN